jgi:tRNA threonylcarbamoyladenosine biosynthesis protein TsaB
MRILAVETSGARGGIALAEDARVIDEVFLDEGLRHGRDLVLTAKAACERAAWDRRRIDLVAVSIGPGSFTGIRIGVTFAKIMAFDTGSKVVAVPSLRVMAENAPPDRRRVVPIVDAKRGGLFASIFERRRTSDVTRAPSVSSGASAPGALLDEFAEIFGPALIEAEDLARHLEAPALILGRGIVKGREALKTFDLAPENLWDPRPGVVARLGAELAARGQFVDPLRLEPIYIRPPEAEELWQRRKRLGT